MRDRQGLPLACSIPAVDSKPYTLGYSLAPLGLGTDAHCKNPWHEQAVKSSQTRLYPIFFKSSACFCERTTILWPYASM